MQEQTLPDVSPDAYHNLGPKTFWYFFSKQAAAGFVFLIFALVISVARGQFGNNPDAAGFLRAASWVSFAIAALSFAVAVVSARLIYKNSGFSLSPDALLLRRGVFTKEQFAIPYGQIQNIEIERTVYDRLVGISKLTILTAGEENEEQKKGSDPEGVLPAIDRDVALFLERELLRRVNAEKVITVK